jgi:hypothetical protein
MSRSATTKTPKYVTETTFERSMRSISLSFDAVQKKLAQHDKLFESILTEMRAVRDDTKAIRSTLREHTT